MDVLADRTYSADRLMPHHEAARVDLREFRCVEIAAADAAQFDLHDYLILPPLR
jgi:hypothetical protein